MEVEYWLLSIVAIGVALGAGFIGGRLTAPRQRRVEEMERERDAAREEAEAVRAEVNRHFEESARMFGKLASDYRTFFEQFAQTARNLGVSEGRARELLQQADPNLVTGEPETPAAPSASPEPGQAGSGPDEAAAAGGPDEHAGDRDAGAEPAPSPAAGDTPEAARSSTGQSDAAEPAGQPRDADAGDADLGDVPDDAGATPGKRRG